METLSPFTPSEHWAACREFGPDTLLRLSARITSPNPQRAAKGLQTFLSGLHQMTAEENSGSEHYFWGGFAVEAVPSEIDSLPLLVLNSAGEDGMDSLLDAVQSLEAAVSEHDPAADIAWTELPHRRA